MEGKGTLEKLMGSVSYGVTHRKQSTCGAMARNGFPQHCFFPNLEVTRPPSSGIQRRGNSCRQSNKTFFSNFLPHLPLFKRFTLNLRD